MTLICQPLSHRKRGISDMWGDRWLLKDSRLTIVGLLLTEELAEGSVASAAPVKSFLFLQRSVRVVCHFGVSTYTPTYVVRISTVSCRLLCILTCVDVRSSVALLDIFSLDIEFTQLLQIINQVMSDSDTLLWLLKCILVSMNLRKYGTILQLKFPHHLQFSHPIWDAAFLQAELVNRDKFKCLLYARGTFLEHLQFLIT